MLVEYGDHVRFMLKDNKTIKEGIVVHVINIYEENGSLKQIVRQNFNKKYIPKFKYNTIISSYEHGLKHNYLIAVPDRKNDQILLYLPEPTPEYIQKID